MSNASASIEVLFVTAAPLLPDYPGGFALRGHQAVFEAAQRWRAGVAFVDTPPHEGLPENVTVEAVTTRPTLADWRLPRQSVGRGVRLGNRAPLVIPLTPNVAHTAFDARRSVVLLEEGWERGLRSNLSGWRHPIARAMEVARYRDLYGRVGRCADAVVAITKREARMFERFMRADIIHTVRVGVETDRFQPSPEDQPDIDVLVLGAVNRPEQEVEAFISAIDRGLSCAVVGGNPRPSIQALASGDVVVTGYVEDIRPWLRRARIVAIPTFTDVGIKTTMLQAWASGRAVATSAAVLDAVPEYSFRDSAEDPAALAQLTTALVANAPRRSLMAQAGIEYVRTHHRIEQVTNDLVELIATVLRADSVTN